MFSRRWTLIVLAGWLVVTIVFVVRDLRPRWTVEEPLAFAIAIGDEPKMSFVGAPKTRHQVETSWRIFRNDQERRGDQAASRIQYNHWSDTLEVGSDFKLRTTPLRRYGSPWLEVESKFRVNWEGQLQEFEVEMRLRREPLLLTNPALIAWLMGSWLPGLTEHVPEWPLLRRKPGPAEARTLAALLLGAWVPAVTNLHSDDPMAVRSFAPRFEERWRSGPGMPSELAQGVWPESRRASSATGRGFAETPLALYTDTESWARCRGVVRNGHFLPHWRVSGENRDPVFNPTALSVGGHLYVPFHPFNRLPGLKLGQRWSMPMLDLEAAVNLGHAREIRTVIATVGETEPVVWQSRPQQVWLVTIRDAETEVGRVWVRQSDLLVLRQELRFSSDHYVLERNVSPDPQMRGRP